MIDIIHIYLRGGHGRDFEGRIGILSSITEKFEGNVLVGARIKILRPILGFIPLSLSWRIVELPLNKESYFPAEIFDPPLADLIMRHKRGESGRFEILGDYYGAKELRTEHERLWNMRGELEIENHFLFEQLKDTRDRMIALQKSVYDVVYKKPIEDMVKVLGDIEKTVAHRREWDYGWRAPEEGREVRGEREQPSPPPTPIEIIEKPSEKKTGLLATIRQMIGGR